MDFWTFLVLLLLEDSTAGTTVLPTLFETDLLYPYGPALDTVNPKVDDGGSALITLSDKLYLFGNVSTHLYVNNNGLLSFNTSIGTFTPSALPVTDGNPFLAPFWADVDNRVAGDIYYRQSTDPDILARATSDIRTHFCVLHFSAQWVFVATWHKVAYYGSQSSSKVNTFQAVLSTDGNLTFILFNYEDIQWTTGTASGGTDGLGGTPALAGLNSGYSTDYYSIPGTMSPAILNVSSTSNVNVTGRWAFRADQLKSADFCDYRPSIGPPTTDSTLAPPPPDTTLAPPPTDTTLAPPPTDTTLAPPPADTTLAPPLTDTTHHHYTTLVPPPTDTTLVPPPTDTTLAPLHTDTHPPSTTDSGPPTTTDSGPPTTTDYRPPTTIDSLPPTTTVSRPPATDTRPRTDLLYPYGLALDTVNPEVDDGGSALITHPSKMYLFGNGYTHLYVNNNGLLSFNTPISTSTPSALPVTDGNPFLAPFWADVDNSVASDIYYRQSKDPGILARATSDIRTYFCVLHFSAQWVFVATWHKVAYYQSSSKVSFLFSFFLP
ncbi:uncharacterized protein LOC142498158 [Ascaphus truei]|uniref:uncharacterized protein LOC142498158 n=1 Tax=Ascaphus truei TaxID=8439 RepID=UPI003F597D3B